MPARTNGRWSVAAVALQPVALLAQATSPPASRAGDALPAAAAAAAPAGAVGRNVWTSLEAMLGAEVRIGASAPEHRAHTDETADGGSGRAAPAAERGEPQQVARVLDLYAAAGTGQLVWAVLDTSRALGTPARLLVPWSELDVQAAAGREPPRLVLSVPPARLRRLPEFAAADATAARLAAAVQRHAAAWRDALAPVADAVADARGARSGATEPRDAHPHAGTEIDAREAAVSRDAGMPGSARDPAAQPELVAARDLLSMRVRYGEHQPFGDVQLALVEPRRGTIEYLVVARGGLLGFATTEYLVPFDATSLVRSAPAERWQLRLDRSKSQMAKAVEYDGAAAARGGAWLAPANAHRAREFFGAVATRSADAAARPQGR